MKFSTVLILSLALMACGTDTGNPGLDPNLGSSPTSGILNGDFIGFKICAKITSCYPGALLDCESKIRQANQLTSHLGVNTVAFPLLQDLITALNSGSVALLDAELQACQSAIANLSCGSAEVTAAYDISNRENLNNTFQMLSASTSCQRMIR